MLCSAIFATLFRAFKFRELIKIVRSKGPRKVRVLEYTDLRELTLVRGIICSNIWCDWMFVRLRLKNSRI